MGELIGGIMMVGMFVVSPIMAGLNAAKNECDLLNQVQDVQNTAAKFVDQETALLNNLKQWDDQILSASGKVKSDMQGSINELQTLKVNFAISMKRLELVIACIIILVFMLLVGKKLKIY